MNKLGREEGRKATERREEGRRARKGREWERKGGGKGRKGKDRRWKRKRI